MICWRWLLSHRHDFFFFGYCKSTDTECNGVLVSAKAKIGYEAVVGLWESNEIRSIKMSIWGVDELEQMSRGVEHVGSEQDTGSRKLQHA